MIIRCDTRRLTIPTRKTAVLKQWLSVPLARLVQGCALAVKIAVVLISATYLVYQFGQGESLTRFLTGLGIAGLAVSLAAQDALKNLFGTRLLIGDRSFRIGDRLLIGDKEGTVEQVGFRSTKLRTPEDSLLILPNALLANGVIDNMGLRTFRRIRRQAREELPCEFLRQSASLNVELVLAKK